MFFCTFKLIAAAKNFAAAMLLSGVVLGEFSNSPVRAADSIFSNSDFSQGQAAPENWTLTKDSDARSFLARDTQIFQTGPAALRLDVQNAKASATQTASVRAGGEILIHGFSKTQGAIEKLEIALQVFDENWKQLDWISIDAAPATDWKRFEKKTVLPSAARNLVFYFAASGNGKAWLDEFFVAPIQTKNDEPNIQSQAKPIGVQKSVFKGDEIYKWRNVLIGAGGYGTGFSVAGDAKNPALFLRTDVSGVWKWDFQNNRWLALTDAIGFDEASLLQVESLAVAPSNPNIIYFSAGGRWTPPSDISKSSDGGKTWRRLHVELNGKPIVMAGNDEFRASGERLAIDRTNPDIVFYGSRDNGLLQTQDGGKTWRVVESFPVKGAAWKGISFVLSGAKGVVFAGAHDEKEGGIFRSKDGGASWQKLDGGMTTPVRAALSGSGVLQVAGGAGLQRLRNDRFEEMMPDKKNFSAVAVSPFDENLIVAHAEKSTFVSQDGGANWREFSEEKQNVLMGDKQFWQPWKTHENLNASVADMVFDPANPKKIWAGAWGGQYFCDDITAPVLKWNVAYKGNEELTFGEVFSPPSGAPLLSGVHDIDGFRHADIFQMPQLLGGDESAPNNTFLEDTKDLDYLDSDPNKMVRVGGWKWKLWKPGFGDAGAGATSSDNGKTWKWFESKPPGAMFGDVAMAANDADNLVWLSMGLNQKPFYSRDGGKSWRESAGAPDANVYQGFWQSYTSRVSSDRVLPSTFYIYDNKSGRFFRSQDGGANWRNESVLPSQDGNHWNVNSLRAAPEIGGEVWCALDDKGLFRSSDGGENWKKIEGVSRARAIGFGKGKGEMPTLYLFGKLESVKSGAALFRSDDLGASWLRVAWSTPGASSPALANAVSVVGDGQKFGRVYVGTSGRGIFCGDFP